jgi:hypothetical protein
MAFIACTIWMPWYCGPLGAGIGVFDRAEGANRSPASSVSVLGFAALRRRCRLATRATPPRSLPPEGISCTAQQRTGHEVQREQVERPSSEPPPTAGLRRVVHAICAHLVAIVEVEQRDVHRVCTRIGGARHEALRMRAREGKASAAGERHQQQTEVQAQDGEGALPVHARCSSSKMAQTAAHTLRDASERWETSASGCSSVRTRTPKAVQTQQRS